MRFRSHHLVPPQRACERECDIAPGRSQLLTQLPLKDSRQCHQVRVHEFADFLDASLLTDSKIHLMTANDDLSSQLQRLRPRLEVIANAIAGKSNVDDVLQEAFLRLASHQHIHEKISDGYIATTIRSISIDIVRRERRTQKALLNKLKSLESSDNNDQEPQFDARTLDCLTEGERRALIAIKLGGTQLEAARSLSLSHVAIRKTIQRARDKLTAEAYLQHVVNDDPTVQPTIRLNSRTASIVAKRTVKDSELVERIAEDLKYREHNRRIKNASLALSRIAALQNQQSSLAETHLVLNLHLGMLYRGQLMYIADALIDFNFQKHRYRFRRDFLLRMHEFASRPARRQLTLSEMLVESPLTLYDLKPVRPLGAEVSPNDANLILKRYLAGDGDIDCRRCVSYQLFRIHPREHEIARSCALQLRDETDQTNANYTVKYLLNQGIRQHRPIYDAELLLSVERIAMRWPRNVFLSNAVKKAHTIVYP